MKSLIPGIKRFFLEEEGASAVEYGILVALIAVAIVITVWAVGKKLEEVFNKVWKCLNNPSTCAT